MTSPHPPDHSRPGEGRHHHDHWLGRIYRLNLIHRGYHLPFSKIFLSVLFVGSAITAILLMAALFVHWADRRDTAIEDGQADARAAAAVMDRQLREIISVAEHVADFDLTEGRFDVARLYQEDTDGRVIKDDEGQPIVNEQSIEFRLRQFLIENPGFWGVGACFERSVNLEPLVESVNNERPEGDGAELYCPYFTRPGGEITFTPVLYDYSDPCLFLPGATSARGTWYQNPRDGGNPWNPPYFGTTSQRMVAEQVVPFFDSMSGRDAFPDHVEAVRSAGEPDCSLEEVPIVTGPGRPTGAVFVNFTLDQVSQNVSWLSLGARGYGLVAAQDQKATYVAHPDPNYFSDPLRIEGKLNQKSFEEIRDEHDIGALDTVLDWRDSFDCTNPDNIPEGGVVDYPDEVTGRDSWLFYEPVPSTCWTLGSVVIKSEALARDSTAHHLLMAVGAATLLSLFAIIALLFRLRGHGWFSWSVTISFSILCIIGVAYIWALVRTTPEVEAGLGGDGQDLAEIVGGYRDKVRADRQSGGLREVAVGVTLDSVEELSGGDVVFSGIAWQRFLVEGDDDSVPGFVLSPNIADTRMEERFDIRNGRERIIGWSFSATLPGPSDVSKFPFDRGEVELPIKPRDIGPPTIFIPDIPSYPLSVPIARPGLGDGFGLAGWSAERSFFTYSANPHDAPTFGRPDSSVRADEPQLSFTVRFARSSINPFVSRMLPVIVVSILVFSLFLVVARTRTDPESFPPSTGVTSLSFLSAMLFVLILGHNSLRSALNPSTLIYLENFYLIMYIAILIVAVRVISFLFGVRVGWTYYRETVTLERLYWPVVTLATLLATWAAFY